MSHPKYANFGFICRQCQSFLSIAELFPSGQYPAGSAINVRCANCSAENSFTPADLQRKPE